MTFTANSFVTWLLSRSYGQGGTVALPNSTPEGDVLGQFPSGVEDVLQRLKDVYSLWPLSQGDDLEWCFLVGGPGNGKSEALRALAKSLNIQLPPKKAGEPAPRSIPHDWPRSAKQVAPGLEAVFINDASIPRDDLGANTFSGSLLRDLEDTIGRFLDHQTPVVLFGNVNRGILVEEYAQLPKDVKSDTAIGLAGNVIRWLVNPPFSNTPLEVKGITTLVTLNPATPYYGQFRINFVNYGANYNVIVHVVFLDVLSLLEPTPVGNETVVDFSVNPPSPAPYQPFGSFYDEGGTRDQTIAGELLTSFIAPDRWDQGGCTIENGVLCSAFKKCPFAQNARWLRNAVLRQRFLDILRGAEIAAARRLTYRDLLGYFSLSILGQPERAWLENQHPCDWIAEGIRDLDNGNLSAPVRLISHRVYSNLFPTPGASSQKDEIAQARLGKNLYGAVRDLLTSQNGITFTRPFNSSLTDIDPAHDIDPWEDTDSKDSIRSRVFDAVEALDEITPSKEIETWSFIPQEALSEIEIDVDAALRDEISTELGKGSREASLRAQFLRKWRTALLLRQVGVALGRVAFRSALMAWLAQQESALRGADPLELGRGISALILPSQSISQYLLAPFRPRTYELDSDLPKNTVFVSGNARDLWVEIVSRGDTLLAEVRVLKAKSSPPETIASLVIDLAIAREALLHANGYAASFTEIGASSFARIERARASLVSRSRTKTSGVYFTDHTGELFQVTNNPVGSTPLRIVRRERP
ncbi:hypothetical protein [Candidatus Chloroploca sp. Khr17]|uniref:hypothetical protein n=1 Tax=Candidatus Chloroploca sp. Khr17 TaxID=2496869 RepID=UPI00101C9A7B|nr:hypothetical protein [Candidatus Chloroploca sp. Khr17]